MIFHEGINFDAKNLSYRWSSTITSPSAISRTSSPRLTKKAICRWSRCWSATRKSAWRCTSPAACATGFSTQHPELYARARALVERGQLEILGGAYYEPILVMLSDDDKIGQIRLLSESVEADFGHATERDVAGGARLGAVAGAPDCAGGAALRRRRRHAFQLHGLQGRRTVRLLRHRGTGLHAQYVPQLERPALHAALESEVEKILGWLREQADRLTDPVQPPPLAVMGDDGEKFGMWPGTFQHCWVERLHGSAVQRHRSQRRLAGDDHAGRVHAPVSRRAVAPTCRPPRTWK